MKELKTYYRDVQKALPCSVSQRRKLMQDIRCAVSGYLQFGLYGILFAVANAVLAVIVGLVFNRKTTMSLFRRALSMVKR